MIWGYHYFLETPIIILLKAKLYIKLLYLQGLYKMAYQKTNRTPGRSDDFRNSSSQNEEKGSLPENICLVKIRQEDFVKKLPPKKNTRCSAQFFTPQPFFRNKIIKKKTRPKNRPTLFYRGHYITPTQTMRCLLGEILQKSPQIQ